MLPHVYADDGYALNDGDAVHEWVVLVVGLCDNQLFVLGEADPDPAREDPGQEGLGKGLFQPLEVCEELVHIFFKLHIRESERITCPTGSWTVIAAG